MVIEIFGIIQQPIDIEKIKIGLYLLPIQKIGYVICQKDINNELNAQQLPQNLKDKNWCLKKASEHSYIIQNVHKQIDIIGLTFLTIFENETNIKKNITENQKKYSQLFNKIHNQTEYIIRVWVDMLIVQKEIVKTTDAIQKLIKEMASSTKGKEFIIKKQIEKEINAQYNTFVKKKLNDFFENMEKNKILFKNLSSNEDKKENQQLVSRITCLVPKNNNDLFDFLEQQDFFSFEISDALPVFNFL